MNGFTSEINRFLNHHLSPAVKIILLTNVGICFSLIFLGMFSPELVNDVVYYLAQNPYLSVKHFHVWQFLTYMFIHVEFWHLFLNMIGLFFFAPALERRWGTRKFWSFYLTAGVGAGIIHAIISLVFHLPEHRSFIIGASGAIYGVLLAFAAYWPNQPIYIWGVVPIKAKYFMIIFVLLAFFSTAGGSLSGVSNLTHLTGVGAAYVWLALRHRCWDLRRWQWMR